MEPDINVTNWLYHFYDILSPIDQQDVSSDHDTSTFIARKSE